MATLGPASNTPETVDELVRAGVDVFRINCAHADHPTIRRTVRLVRQIAKRHDDGSKGLGKEFSESAKNQLDTFFAE